MAKKVRVKCFTCGKPTLKWPYELNQNKRFFCNKQCWQNRAIKVCENCGYKYHANQATRRFCSRSCGHAFMVGTNSTNFKGGHTVGARTQYANRLKVWREKVYRRDNWTCTTCGTKGDIQAHHIKSFAEFVSLRLVVANGTTLCIDCHSKVHGKDLRTHKPHQHCADCSKRVQRRATRCHSCATKHLHTTKKLNNRKSPIVCLDCGAEITRRAKRCQSCNYIHLSRRACARV